ncbi:MAG: RDD family protein [Verrucomicrobiota bacterium]|jgi:uncharacterized RDD family membrane protein YckC
MKIAKIIHSSLAAALGLLLLAPGALNGAETQEAEASTNAPAAAPTKTKIHHDALVSIGQDVELKAGESAEAVVVIGGSARVLGDVDNNVVVIGGDADVRGDVGNKVVTVMGNAHLGPKAAVHGDLVTVGGKATVADGATVGGHTQEVGIGAGLAGFPRVQWLRKWFRDCVMELRPLAPGVGWLWWIAGTIFLVYWLIAVLFPHPVQCCVNQLSARPGTTLAVGILAKLAMPFVYALLLFTCIGIIVIPFVFAAGLLALLVGKVAILQYLGGRLGSPFGLKSAQAPVFAFLIGAVLVTLLYMVPIIGLLTLIGVSLWGFGAAVTAICVALRRETPPPAPMPPLGFVPPGPGEGFSAQAAPPAGAAAAAGPAISLPQALAFPRAGFWERMGAGFLDMAVICLSTALAGSFTPLVGVAYFTGMWAWKGTTVGGIVLNLQVVRQDGQPLSFLAAFVRCVAAVFSALVLFLGFFWIGWDREKQGWHDKIAGTVVVRLPRPIALVCL